MESSSSRHCRRLILWTTVIALLFCKARGIDIFLEWNVSSDPNIRAYMDQPLILINGKITGPLINATTNDIVHVNIFNNLDEPLLMTWNGIQQRLNSWQDGVSGTNCPILPGQNWTYVFQTKDQIGSYFYFPSINFLKAAGGYGPIRVNNRNVILVPFAKPEAEYDLLIGDWSYGGNTKLMAENPLPDLILMNGKAPFNPRGNVFQSFNVTKDYFMVATPTQIDTTAAPDLMGVGLIHYDSSNGLAAGSLPKGPDQLDRDFSINQARSIRWNMSTGAARPNPQGTFNVSNITLSQTFILHASTAEIDGILHYTVNNVSYLTPDTPLKLADHFVNGSGVYQLDSFPTNSINLVASYGTSVVTGNHKGWLEIVFKNDLDVMDAWHLDGFGFYVVGFGDGDWNSALRSTYNLVDPVVRSTVQVYPGGWTAVYAFLDNPGMWSLRSQRLENWYGGQELYIRVFDADPNPAKERPPPSNLLLCGIFKSQAPAPSPQVAW
ncbi:Monocopper oxidase-like protein sku5 [Thalictrum thalictroides]|uniref:Monocopper oxidase-like protein sku5 n=1 Tax=Thalictrum thalictroides TaxID=46969 RepID=A0A7J6VAP0_THATH|nr:Monocopper oxidase-like protein sku5 [Thalictrum thalictroides]